MKDDFIFYIPPPFRKDKEQIRRECSNCMNEKCRRRWMFVCWLNCKEWEPELNKKTIK